MGPAFIGVEVQRDTDRDTPSREKAAYSVDHLFTFFVF